MFNSIDNQVRTIVRSELKRSRTEGAYVDVVFKDTTPPDGEPTLEFVGS